MFLHGWRWCNLSAAQSSGWRQRSGSLSPSFCSFRTSLIHILPAQQPGCIPHKTTQLSLCSGSPPTLQGIQICPRDKSDLKDTQPPDRTQVNSAEGKRLECSSPQHREPAYHTQSAKSYLCFHTREKHAKYRRAWIQPSGPKGVHRNSMKRDQGVGEGQEVEMTNNYKYFKLG